MHSKGRVVQYTVALGRYIVHITVLHLSYNVPERNSKMIGSGAFGKVLLESAAMREFVVKQQYFSMKHNSTANKQEIEELILEVSIYKLCSAFGIGPKVSTVIPFDLICYENAAEFHL